MPTSRNCLRETMQTSIDEAIHKSLTAHKLGDLDEADRLISAVLNVQPNHPEANHSKGLIAISNDQTEKALPFLKAAILMSPNEAQFWLSYCEALMKLGRWTEAKLIFEKAKEKCAQGEQFTKIRNILEPKSDPTPNRTGLLDKAISLREKGDYKAAISLLKNNLDENNEDASQLALLAHCYILDNDLRNAEAVLKRARELDPENASVGWNTARLSLKKNRREFALKVAKQTSEKHPNDVEGMAVLGSCFRVNGQLEEAIVKLDNAIDHNSKYAEAYINRGLVLLSINDRARALSDLERAFELRPHISSVWGILVPLFFEFQKFDAAIPVLELVCQGESADAKQFAMLATCYQKVERETEAIECYVEALTIEPDFDEAFYNLGIALQQTEFTGHDIKTNNILLALLDKQTVVRPINISRAIVSLLKYDPIVANLSAKYRSNDQSNTISDTLSQLFRVPLLLKLMRVCPVPDLDLEHLLTAVRAEILKSLSSIEATIENQFVLSSLAQQSFYNEYSYQQSTLETKRVRQLELSIEQNYLSGNKPDPLQLLCLACYKPISELSWLEGSQFPTELTDTWTVLVENPREELKLKKGLPILSDISNGISVEVQEQYEENPYPRWVHTELRPNPASIAQVMTERRLKLSNKAILNVDSPEILVAGCGTGQHSLSTAKRYANSNVLAVDLSLSSLAFAKRKTREFGVKNIKYMQADILELNKLRKQFDIIESVGVLHHMSDPMAGWKVLADMLTPGGMMRIGLYSEIARQDIVKIRSEIQEDEISPTVLEIRAFRNRLSQSSETHHLNMLSIPDFFNLSEIRDLLFNVQEHRFTIPQIQNCLSKLDLLFCGFEGRQLVNLFKSVYRHENDQYDLAKWHEYEMRHPYTFRAMYQFWCQKPV